MQSLKVKSINKSRMMGGEAAGVCWVLRAGTAVPVLETGTSRFCWEGSAREALGLGMGVWGLPFRFSGMGHRATRPSRSEATPLPLTSWGT